MSSSASSSGPVEVYVGNLKWGIDEAALKRLFEEFCEVRHASIARWPNGSSKGFGFLKVPTLADANEAVARMHKAIVDGRELKVAIKTGESGGGGGGARDYNEQRDSRREPVTRDRYDNDVRAAPYDDRAAPPPPTQRYDDDRFGGVRGGGGGARGYDEYGGAYPPQDRRVVTTTGGGGIDTRRYVVDERSSGGGGAGMYSNDYRGDAYRDDAYARAPSSRGGGGAPPPYDDRDRALSAASSLRPDDRNLRVIVDERSMRTVGDDRRGGLLDYAEPVDRRIVSMNDQQPRVYLDNSDHRAPPPPLDERVYLTASNSAGNVVELDRGGVYVDERAPRGAGLPPPVPLDDRGAPLYVDDRLPPAYDAGYAPPPRDAYNDYGTDLVRQTAVFLSVFVFCLFVVCFSFVFIRLRLLCFFGRSCSDTTTVTSPATTTIVRHRFVVRLAPHIVAVLR